jgi:hypothetical protein
MLRDNSRLAFRGAALIAGALAIASLTGCETAIPRHDAGAFIGNQGNAWEALYPMPSVDGQGTQVAAGPETWRRDAALGAGDSTYTAAGTWSDDRPRFQDIRWIYLHPRPDAVYFYDSSYRRPWWR